MRRTISTLLAAFLAVGVMAIPATANPPMDTLADMILADADGEFDNNKNDYDIIGEIVLAILNSGIETQLGAAADPDAELTVFLPNDRAFFRLAYDLTGVKPAAEADVIGMILDAVGGDLDLVNTIVEYHVVPGIIDSAAALEADGAKLATVAGPLIKVKVKDMPTTRIILMDQDPDARNAGVLLDQVDNFASNGVWHGINRVLRPINV